jgi:hypothetical protein
VDRAAAPEEDAAGLRKAARAPVVTVERHRKADMMPDGLRLPRREGDRTSSCSCRVVVVVVDDRRRNWWQFDILF